MTDPDQACPSCGIDDQVVAASAYASVTDPEVQGDDDRVPPDLVGSFLEKPGKPVAARVLTWAAAPLVPIVLFFIYWFAPIHKGFKFFLLGWTIAFWVSVFVPALVDMEMYAFLGLCHLLLYWAALFAGRRQHKVEYLTRRIPEYHAMLARWERMRYCKRCQRAWLDNASGAAVGVTEIEAMLKG
jgi:hypothetical protein